LVLEVMRLSLDMSKRHLSRLEGRAKSYHVDASSGATRASGGLLAASEVGASVITK